MPLIQVNEILIDPRALRCGKQTENDKRCAATAGDNGIVEITTSDDGLAILKIDVTCGIHVNKMAGDAARYVIMRHAVVNEHMVDRISVRNI
jgi:hypothetical protein